MLISVIIPVYNSGKYIDKCLTNIVNQTYSNLEILIVNDGSIDNSMTIIQKYAEEDDRIKVFEQKNSGQASARNLGLTNARGKYIVFVDSDDFIDNNFCEIYINEIEKNNVDIVSGAYSIYNDHYQLIRAKQTKYNGCFNNTKAVKKLFLKKGIEDYLWAKIFKRELFSDIKLPEERYFEDMATVYKLLLKSKTIKKIKYNGYCYVIHKQNTTSKYNMKKIYDFFTSLNEIENYVNNKRKDLNKFFYIYKDINTINLLYSLYIKNKRDAEIDLTNIYNKYKKNMYSVLWNIYIPIIIKIKLIRLRLKLK